MLSDPHLLWELNLSTITQESLVKGFTYRRFFPVEGDGEMQGVCVWFSCNFPVSPSSMNDDSDEGESLKLFDIEISIDIQNQDFASN